MIAESIPSNKVFGFKNPKIRSQTESEGIKYADVVEYSNDLSISLAVVDVPIPTLLPLTKQKLVLMGEQKN